MLSIQNFFIKRLCVIAVLGIFCSLPVVYGGEYVSQVWCPDNGDGTYSNPVINADYSDPDVCRAGNDYYLTASSFQCIPGLPILHSNDLVNWTLVNYAIPYKYEQPDGLLDFSLPQHGNGVWAPSIRFYKDTFYIYYGDPDAGVFMTKTTDPKGAWSKPQLVKAGKGLIDACPLWDDNGQMYLVHAFAGSRAGMKSVLAVTPLRADGTADPYHAESKIIYDGHQGDVTIEGPKFYKKDGYYYIFAPAGGVATGWQVVLRSKNIYGPYEQKIVMAQGKTNINGPHQGAWVDTPDEQQDWFLHFQDRFAYGRVVHLQPMLWKNGWPIIGTDKNNDGCGDPVTTYTKPAVGKQYPICNPAESDEFNENTLGLQWQWHSNSNPLWYFTDAQAGVLRLFSAQQPANAVNLYGVGNLLLQKMPAQTFRVTTKVRFCPLPKKTGERAGLIVMGLDYAVLTFENTANGLVLSQNSCLQADNGSKEVKNESITVQPNTYIYLSVRVQDGAVCSFSYSLDGRNYTVLGKDFTAKEGKWIGAKVGLFCTRNFTNNDSGWLDVDWFRITK